MIKCVIIKNFKIYEDFEIELNPGCTILVGDNESGKSTILEAINLALTKRINGRSFEAELTTHLFNKTISSAYIERVRQAKTVPLPKLTIELYFHDIQSVQFLRGTNNSKGENTAGLKIEAEFNEDYRDEYAKFIDMPDGITSVPVEYYHVCWLGFSGNAVTQRTLPISTSLIDATSIRLQSGADYYLQDIINETLTAKDRVELAMAYRGLKEEFFANESISAINTKLQSEKGNVTEKEFSIGLDMSNKSAWENSVVAHLDQIPFQYAGKGAQNKLKIMLALNRHLTDTGVILVEEPENHLSFSSMTRLISQIESACMEKQVVMTTHSTYVLNKIGLEKLVLLSDQRHVGLRDLSDDTYGFFKKLPGYETLRMIVAKKVILVEGASDELILQKAYLIRFGRLPIADGVDVISVGLAFKRFLEIAQRINIIVAVVTDNDGDYEKNITEKYRDFSGAATITVCADSNVRLPTLEPQLVDCNNIETFNSIFGRQFGAKEDVIQYMTANKTEAAVRIFETELDTVVFPKYIMKAINAVRNK